MEIAPVYRTAIASLENLKINQSYYHIKIQPNKVNGC
jgi:hypothetical protein